jgi:peptide/nickel transport system permease protein
MNTLKRTFKDLLQYPSAIAGLVVIILLVAVSIYVLITIPYDTAIKLWRGGEDVWYMNPKFAPPAWFNNFTDQKLTESFTIKSSDSGATREVIPGDDDTSKVNITYTFDYDFDVFPQEMLLYFSSNYDAKQPFVSMKLSTPDGRELRVADFGGGRQMTDRFSQGEKL